MAEECVWEVDGLRLSGLAWGPEDGTPVLALHGWMDHAASFTELAPKLKSCRVVALDLSGQGHSAHRAAHATYNIWDDLPQVVGVLDQLGWDQCVLLSHSRGANIALLLAAALPERVRALIALDSIAPEPVKAESVVETLRAFVLQTKDQMARPPRHFDSTAAYVARRTAQGNAEVTAQALAERALEPDGDSVRMRADRRLFASSALKLTRPQIDALMRAVRCPVLNIWARDGIKASRPMLQELAGFAEEVMPQYRAVEIAGDHHFHLHPESAAKIALAIRDFL